MGDPYSALVLTLRSVQRQQSHGETAGAYLLLELSDTAGANLLLELSDTARVNLSPSAVFASKNNL